MCRWLVYSGSPVPLDSLLYKPQHSLIDQSLNTRLGPHTTNGDGFGIGWYSDGDEPALYKGVNPAWNDQNLRELSRHISSRVIFAHIRASTGTPVQYTNCHPFRHGKWLWMHNGQIAGFHDVKRELVLAVDPDLYTFIKGSSDTEAFFFLALTFGLEQDPPGAVARAVGFIEQVCLRQGIEHPMRMSVAVSDGHSAWAFRYSSEGVPPSLYFSTKVATLRAQHPDISIFQTLTDESRLIVSEPIGDLAGAWNEVPASTYAMIRDGEDEINPFTPQPG
ncbi:MAG: class II glutamine amidotransferase [Allosphingosinicella sp.]